MTVMFKLRLPPELATFEAVRRLPGLKDLNLDPEFGIVAISPTESLYVVRTKNGIHDLETRRGLSSEIIEAYGDIRISTT